MKSFKTLIFVVLVLVLFPACVKETQVQLPKVPVAELAALTNHSQAYIFYDINQKDSILLNRKNLIMNTNWVIHVDARLILKKIMPKLQLLYQKRNKKSIHTKKGMKNYFSVMDVNKKQLGFIDYSVFKFKHPKEHAKFFIKKSPDFHIDKHNVIINFDCDNKITVNGNDVDRDELTGFLKEEIDFVSEGRKTLIYLNFDEQLTFEKYLNNYLTVSKLVNDTIKIAEQQFIYNYDELPDCNCKL